MKGKEKISFIDWCHEAAYEKFLKFGQTTGPMNKSVKNVTSKINLKINYLST